MWIILRQGIVALLLGAACCLRAGYGQTPEQTQLWEQQRLQAQAEERTRAEVLARDRAARKADPMAWVRTLDPMTSGGWEFRAVAADGSWAAYATKHQLRKSGSQVTVWLRQEYAEPQTGPSGRYQSVVQKIQFDCAKERSRALLVIYYAGNNVQGAAQADEADPKTTTWTAIVPGTRDESDFRWSCAERSTASLPRQEDLIG